MNLVSHITGVGPTAAFTPGATTTAPFNVPHTGLTDGTGPASASKNMAEIYNRIMLQIASTIEASGLIIDNNNWAQLPQAVEKLAEKSTERFMDVNPPKLSLVGQTLSITGGSTVTLPDKDNQTLLLAGKSLSISGGNTVTLPDKDNQTLSLTGQSLSISGGNTVTIPSSPPQTLAISGQQLSISGGNSVTLPTLSSSSSHITVSGGVISLNMATLIQAVFSGVSCADYAALVSRCSVAPVGGSTIGAGGD